MLLVDLLSSAAQVWSVETWRSLGPELAVRRARQAGKQAHPRSPEERRRLGRAIRIVDQLCGANCYRRVLLELALDSEAANDPVYFGLIGGTGTASGADQIGHAWRGEDPAMERRYRAVFRVA